jgi:hypothetical protein
MGVHSGKWGVVNGKSAVRNWQVNKISSPKKAVASHTRGGPLRKRGIFDWSGSYGAYGKQPLILPGQNFAFAGYCAPNNGVEGGTGDVYSGQAIVDSVAMTWNFEAADILSHTVNFSAYNSPLAESTGVYADETDPELTTAISLGITAEGETIANIKSVTLTLTSENKTYVNSSTNGWTYRDPGTIDATLAITVDDTNASEFGIDVGDDAEFKLFVNDTEFYLLRWMHFKERTGLNVDRESGNIVGFTANFELNGLLDTEEGLERGSIVLPDETVFWTAEAA